MTATFHFIAGLPRSGSTLLAALLRQNPRFHASMSSPLARMTSALLVEMTGEDGPLVPQDKRRRVLHGLFDAYYAQERAARKSSSIPTGAGARACRCWSSCSAT